MNKYWIKYRYFNFDNEEVAVSKFVTTDDLEEYWEEEVVVTEYFQYELLQVVKL